MALYGKGALSRMGFKKATATAWGTAIALVALDGVRYLKEGITKEVDYLGRVPDRHRPGAHWRPRQHQGGRGHRHPVLLRGPGADAGAALRHGRRPSDRRHEREEARLQDQQLRGGHLRHPRVRQGRRAARGDVGKITKITIKGGAGQRTIVTFTVAGYDLINNSAVNTSGAFASVTYPAPLEWVLGSQLITRINAQGGGALGATDAVYVKDYEITIERSWSPTTTPPSSRGARSRSRSATAR
jgi:hypothetical protein